MEPSKKGLFLFWVAVFVSAAVLARASALTTFVMAVAIAFAWCRWLEQHPAR